MRTSIDPAAAIVELRQLAGEEAVISDPDALESFCVDWQNEFGAPALALVRPKTVEEVARTVRFCAENNIAIVPQGGNTSLAGGAVPIPDRTQVIFSLSRMNAVRSIEPFGMTITVEAGAILENVQKAAEQLDLQFPVTFGAQGSSQIGGAISTNAGGINVLRHGMMRQQVLGLEVVLGDGSVISGLRPLRKDNAGYDWKQLFIGAEGTLGLVTAATLRLTPQPRHKMTACLAVGEPDDALKLFADVTRQLGDAIVAFELISPMALDLLKEQFGLLSPLGVSSWTVLIEAASSLPGLHQAVETSLASALETGSAIDAVVAQSNTQSSAIWTLRERIPEAELRSGRSIKHDVSVPISQIPNFIKDASRAVQRAFERARINVFGHVGDGNIHFNVLDAPNESKGMVNQIVHNTVIARGGSISAEHGIGCYRLAELEQYKHPAELQLMRSIKKSLDPSEIFNPGKVLRLPLRAIAKHW